MAASEKRFPRLLAGVDSKTGEHVIALCDGEYSGEVVIGLDFADEKVRAILDEIGIASDEAARDHIADLLGGCVVYVKYANVKIFNREIDG